MSTDRSAESKNLNAMKNLISRIMLLSILLFSVAVPVLAQAAPPATPIDGGLGILLAGGAAYGLKKLRDSKKG